MLVPQTALGYTMTPVPVLVWLRLLLPDWPGNAARHGVSLVFSHYCSSDICCLSEVAVVLVFHILQKAVDGSGDVRAPEAVLPPEFFLVASRFLAIATS